MSIKTLKFLFGLDLMKFSVVADGGGSDDDKDGDDKVDDGSDFTPTGDDKDDSTKDDKSGDKADDDKDDADADKDKDADKSDDKDKDKDKGKDDDADDKTPALMVPKSRLDFKNRRIKALEDELEESRNAVTGQTDQQEEKTFEATLADLNADLTKAHVDSDMEKAGEIQAHIQTLMVERIDSIAAYTHDSATSDATDQIKLDSMIDALEAKHTILDEAHKDFDQELSDEVLDMYDTLSNSGKYSKPDALARSVELIMGPNINIEGAPGGRKTDIDKNIADAEKTAPRNDGKDSDEAGVGNDLQPSKLSDAEFEALPEETKSRLRGDIL